MKLIDYHMHTRFSPDSEANPDDMCAAALKMGISSIAITDHKDFFCPDALLPKDDSPDEMPARKSTLLALRDKYRGKLDIAYGVEVGQALHNKEASDKFMRENEFDFVLGSIHHIFMGEDFFYVKFTFENSHIYQSKYYAEMVEFSQKGDFDILAHLNYPDRYLYKRLGGVSSENLHDVRNYREEVRQILKNVISRGKGIEINTAEMRQEIKTAFLPEFILRDYRELGGEFITIGSDAHRAEHCGFYVKESAERLASLGFKYLTTYADRKPTQNLIL